MIPEKAQAKVQVAVVKAVGPGSTLDVRKLFVMYIKIFKVHMVDCKTK